MAALSLVQEMPDLFSLVLFFFTDTATTEIYTLSLHDALPICGASPHPGGGVTIERAPPPVAVGGQDRKSTRLNSSHVSISYAVFCLKKKNRRTCPDVLGPTPYAR